MHLHLSESHENPKTGSAQSGPAEEPLAQEGDAGRDTEAPMTGAPAETLDNYIEPENEENFLDMLNRCASVSAPISQTQLVFCVCVLSLGPGMIGSTLCGAG
jgi:hypothetical protein